MTDKFILSGEVALNVTNAGKQVDSLKDKMKEAGKAGDDAAKKVEDKWKKAGQTLTKFGSTMTKNFTLPIVGLGIAAVKLASDLDESMGKASVVFGDSYDAIEAWSEGAIDSMGLAKETAIAAAADFGNMATSMGLNQEASADLSMDLVQLAADMASFNNVSVERTNTALRGIFTGEGEALKSLGVNMNDAELQAYALANGYTKVYKEMNQSEKTMLRYNYVMSKTKNAQGDFARTSDSVSNKTRSLGERIKELGAELGQNLLPIVSNVIGFVSDLVKSFTNLSESQQNTILWAAGIVAAIGPILTVLGKLSTAVSGIGKLFGTSLSAATLGWVAVAAAGIAGVVALVSTAEKRYQEIYEESRAIKQTVSDFKNDMAAIETDFLGKKEDLLDSAELAATLLDRIDELEKGGLSSAAAQREHALAIEQVKQLFPQLDIAIDTNTGYVEGGTQAIRDNIDALVDQALAALLLEKQEEQLTAVAQAQLDLFQAQKKQAEYLKKNEAAITKYTKAEKGLADALGITASEVRKMSIADLINHYHNGSAEVKIFSKEIMESTIASGNVINEYYKLGDSVASFELALVDANGQVIMTQQDMKDLGVSVEDAGDAAEDAAGQVDTLADAEEDAAKAAKELEDAQKELQRVTEEYDAAVLQATDNIVNNFEKMNMRSGASLRKAVKNLEYNNEQVRLAMLNHQTLTEKGFGKDFLDYLYNMGPEGMRLLAEGVKDPVRLAELEIAWNAAGSLAAGEVADGYTTNIATEWEAANAKFIELNKATGVEGATALQEGYTLTIEDDTTMEDATEKAAKAAATKLEKGLGSKDEEVSLVMLGYGKEITKTQPELENIATETGEIVGQQTADSIADKDEEVTLAMLGFGPAITDAQPQLTDAADEVGSQVGQSTSDAIEDKDEEVYLSMEGLITTDASLSVLASQNGAAVGSDMGQGLANGLDSKIAAVKAAARRLANAATGSMKVTAEIKSPSKKMEREIGVPMAQGVVVGLEQGLKNMMGKIKASTNGIVGGLTSGTANVASQAKASSQSMLREALVGKQGASVVQNNTFTTQTLSPYEQRVQLYKMDKDLAEVFA